MQQLSNAFAGSGTSSDLKQEVKRLLEDECHRKILANPDIGVQIAMMVTPITTLDVKYLTIFLQALN